MEELTYLCLFRARIRMLKLTAIIILVLIAFVMMRRNKKLHRNVRAKRREILDRMADPKKGPD
ncbi:hypothetical protein MJD09_13635 [bacterium]|nr:hypothetical protein [bacterium]